jgi:pyridoxal phosphate enzyme (YggS family)
MSLKIIEDNTVEILNSLPPGVTMVAAAKTRTPEEVEAVINAGIKIVGYNYLQEAERMRRIIGDKVKWHMIGHLQRNKVKKAVLLFDMIETIDSVQLAEAVDKQCALIEKKMPVLVEINSGREANKSGVMPEDVFELVKEISNLPQLQVQGLMTMGAVFGDPEGARPYFKTTKKIFDRLKEDEIPNVEMRYLSMGMSASYQAAIEDPEISGCKQGWVCIFTTPQPPNPLF